jgi:hypothetical protein
MFITIITVWAAGLLGFLAGCLWAGRNRRGVRERATDFAPDHVGMTPKARERIWRKFQDGLAVENLLRSL